MPLLPKLLSFDHLMMAAAAAHPEAPQALPAMELCKSLRGASTGYESVRDSPNVGRRQEGTR
jgi:hypothetical protein